MADQVMVDDDAPELDDAFFARAKPMTEVLTPAQQRAFKPRGPQKEPTKKLVSLRLSPKVIEHFKASGKGWQSRIDAKLLDAVAAEMGSAKVKERPAPIGQPAPRVAKPAGLDVPLAGTFKRGPMQKTGKR